MKIQATSNLRILVPLLACLHLAASDSPANPAASHHPQVHTTWTSPKADDYTLVLITNGQVQVKDGLTMTPASPALTLNSPIGQGFSLSGGQTLTIDLPTRPGLRDLTVQMQIRPTRESGVLLTMMGPGASERAKPLWTLERDPEGQLVFIVADQEELRTESVLPAGQWRHLSLSIERSSFPMNIVVLRVDGIEVGRTHLNHRLPLSGPSLRIGGGQPADFDGLELSSGIRRAYAREDNRADPQSKRPERRGQPWFRNPDQLVASHSFDQVPDGAHRVQGLRGDALLLSGRVQETTVDLPWPEQANLLEQGVIDFFIQPVDWDNALTSTAVKPRDPFTDENVALLEIIGRNAAGQEQVLASWTVNRADDSYRELPGFRPGKWMHVTITWEKGNLRSWYDGQYVFPGSRRGLSIQRNALRQFKPVTLRLRSGEVTTIVDELSIHQGKMTDQELLTLAHRLDPELTPLGEVSIVAERQLYHPRIRVNYALNTPRFADAAQAVIRVYDRQRPGEVVGEKTISTAEQASQGLTFVDVEGYDEGGDYAVQLTFLDKNGVTLAQSHTRVPDYNPPWFKTAQGVMTEVPPPWTPINIEQGKLHTWSTTYALNEDGWLQSAVTLGEPLLTGPMFMIVSSERGGPMTFQVKGNQPLVNSGGTEARWSSQIENADLLIRIEACLEFDGMIRYDLTLEPKKAVNLSELTLNIPLVSSLMPLHHAIALGSGGSSAGALAIEEGVVWDSASAYEGKNGSLPPASGSFATPSDRKWRKPLAAGSFIPMIWVGNEERGFSWFADNDFGWVPSDDKPAVELIRDHDTLLLRLNLFGETHRLEAPRTITFGILPTPTKPAPTDARAWHRGGTEAYPLVGNIGASFSQQSQQLTGLQFGIFALYGWDFAEAGGQLMKNPNRARLIYMSAYWIGERLKDWYRHAWEWEGTHGGRAHFTPSYVDYLAWEFGEWFGRDILDGVYIDEVYPNFNARVEAGGAYLLPDGKVQPTTSIFQQREFFKRLWGVSVANGKKPPIIIQHMTGTMVPALISFATVTLDGESNYLRKDRPDFMDLWPIDRIRAMNLGAGGGNVALWLPMLDPNTDAFKTDLAWRRAATRNTLAVLLLHDIWSMFDRADSPFIYSFTGPALRSWDIAGPGVDFTGYWDASPLATTDNPEVLVSSYHQSGKALLVVTNFSREAADVGITPDWRILDIRPDTAKAVDLEARFYTDSAPKVPFDPAIPPVLQDGKLRVTVGPRDYRLISLEKR